MQQFTQELMIKNTQTFRVKKLQISKYPNEPHTLDANLRVRNKDYLWGNFTSKEGGSAPRDLSRQINTAESTFTLMEKTFIVWCTFAVLFCCQNNLCLSGKVTKLGQALLLDTSIGCRYARPYWSINFKVFC